MNDDAPSRKSWHLALLGTLLVAVAYSPTVITLSVSESTLHDLKVQTDSLQRELEGEDRFDALLSSRLAQAETSDARRRDGLAAVAERLNLTQAGLRISRQQVQYASGDVSERLSAITTSVQSKLATKSDATEMAAINLHLSGALSELQQVQHSVKLARRDLWLRVDENRRQLRELSQLGQTSWNIWAEESSLQPTFTPVATPGTLQQDRTYLLVMDLSAVAYVTREGVRYRATGEALRKQIAEWLRTNPDASEVPLKVLLLPDPYYFETPLGSDRVGTLRVNLTKVRKILDKGALETPDAPFASLKQNSNPDFVLGRVFFNIKTKSHPGFGSIGLSIWVDGKRPVDELSAPFCIASPDGENRDCENASPVAYSLKGIDSLRLASDHGPLPDAALDFVELDSGTVIGVFRCNDCDDWGPDDYRTWPLRRSAVSLSRYLKETSLADFADTTDPDELLQHGKELYELLFPVRNASDAVQARQDFEKFVRVHLSQKGAADAPPSIFVRLLANDADPPFLLPLGFMVPDTDPKDFLGFHFRIETPLEEQSYATAEGCLSNWAMLLPPEDAPEELRNARKQFGKWNTAWKTQPGYMDFTRFKTWIADPTPDNKPTALMILSHHDKNKLYFALPHTVESTLVLHNFREPSLAILNACGTAAAGATEFVRELNRGGINSLIATSTKLSPYMAGDFVNILAQVLFDNRKTPGFTISQAVFRAVNQLKDKESSDPVKRGMKYGAKALIYLLVGNGSLRLCLPGEKRP